ncbi:MAG TPA: VacB/RNase II family 3'-5' exoribonuclease, partial [Chlamydiales bacterium]|nr:VacB/RNase II family 3'-5' exoribonuclease [Chlamydiales bacterium]
KLFQNLLRTTYEFIKGKRYNPLNRLLLIDRLQIHPDHLDIFDQVLKHLKDVGHVKVNQEKYLLHQTTQKSLQQGPPQIDTDIETLQQTKQLVEKQPPFNRAEDNREDIVVGVIRLHPRGFGFVEVEGQEVDIFIPKPYVNGAVDGDRVEVLINRESVSEKGPDGKILSVIERKRSQIVGIIAHLRDKHPMAYSSLLGDRAFVVVEQDSLKKPKESLKVGDRVLLEVTDWGSQKTAPHAVLKEKLGSISDPTIDIQVAILEYDLRQEFPEEAKKEALAFGTKVARQDLEGREDLTELECFTIDPDTAKDFDDAISVVKEKKHYVLGVHIADVSHYVKPGSHLDKEARLRCNSTYFPGKCVPMLPHELSDNLCSLKEGVLRLTVSVFLTIDFQGNILNSRISRSVIKSKKRFTYKQAKQVLDGELKSSHKLTLQELETLCHLLKKKRAERGSVELTMPELVLLVDTDGVATGTEVVQYDITHQMVEECMLLANETVAKHLSSQGKELTWRVHEEPAAESLREFAVLVEAFGYKLPASPTPEDIQALFVTIPPGPTGQYLATCYIRSMRLACYSADNIGHYGLSLEHYCHFTSPIRRYVDTIAHRLLFEPAYDKKTIEAICKDASDRERLSAKAEMSVKQLKKLRYLDKLRKEKEWRQFEAVVTRIKPFGIYFDLIELMLEGFLHISELDGDYFIFDDKRLQLRGRHHGMVYRAGDPLFVLVKDIDFITQEATFELVSHETTDKKAADKKTAHKVERKKPKKRQIL